MITVFEQGWEDIMYDRYEGNTLVYYYLLCDLDGDKVIHPSRTLAFGYSPSHNLYFELYESTQLQTLRTRKEVDEYVVASRHPVTMDDVCPLSAIIQDDSYYTVWMNYHRKHYDWLYQ
jgi:hypothetical protein